MEVSTAFVLVVFAIIVIILLIQFVRLVMYVRKINRNEKFFDSEWDRHITNTYGTYNAKYRRMRGWE